jgi:hypothetical protein
VRDVDLPPLPSARPNLCLPGLICAVLPPNRRAAPDFTPNLERLKSTRDAAGPLGLTLVPAEPRGLDALEQAFATITGERAQALTVLSDGVLFNCLLTRADEVIE